MKQLPITNLKSIRAELNKYELTLICCEPTGKQFKSCMAWEVKATVCYLDDEGGIKTRYECPALQSYNTLVAIIVDGVLYRGKFSPTTSKQITQWARTQNYVNVVNFEGEY